MNIALDNNIVQYLVEAAAIGYNPSEDVSSELAKEREAAYQIFRHTEILYAPQTPIKECSNNSDAETKKNILQFLDIHFIIIKISDIDLNKVESFKNGYMKYHGKEKDCLSVAEAKAGKMNYFLTFDKDLKKRLQKIENDIQIVFP